MLAMQVAHLPFITKMFHLVTNVQLLKHLLCHETSKEYSLLRKYPMICFITKVTLHIITIDLVGTELLHNLIGVI